MEENSWNKLHIDLRDSLQNEVRLTRELLANMHREEVSRLLGDQGMLNQILTEQSHLVERLGKLRLDRQEMTGTLETMVTDAKKAVSVDALLPPTEETTLEIL